MQRWLRDTSPDRTVRNESMLRVFMLWLLESSEAIAFFDEEIESHRHRLAGFEETLADDERQRREHGTAQGGIAFCASLALSGASDTSANTSSGPARLANASRPARRGGTTRASDG